MGRIAFLTLLLALGCGRTPLTGGDGGPTPTNSTATPTPTPVGGGGLFRTITVDPGQVFGDHADFPVFIEIQGDTDLRSTSEGGNVLNDDGSDIAFELDGGALVSELIDYDNQDGDLSAWVRIPMLSGSVPTEFLLRYGDAATVGVQGTPSDVWSAGYVSVWHMDNGNQLDSTSNQLNASAQGDVTTSAGQVDRAQFFDNDNDYLTVQNAQQTFGNGGLEASTEDFTISAWIFLDSRQGDWDTVFEKGLVDVDGGYGFYIDRNSGGEDLALYMKPGDTIERHGVPVTVALSTWYHVAAIVDRSAQSIEFVLDGVSIGSDNTPSVGTAASINTNGQSAIGINSNFNSCCPVRGGLDEIRIANVERAVGWVQTEHANQADVNTFLTVGAEQTY